MTKAAAGLAPRHLALTPLLDGHEVPSDLMDKATLSE